MKHTLKSSAGCVCAPSRKYRNLSFSRLLSSTRLLTLVCAGLATLLLALPSASILNGQDADSRFRNHLRSGEFSSAIRAANSNGNGNQTNMWLRQIAHEQASSGAHSGSYDTAAGMTDDRMRNQTLYNLRQNSTDGNGGAGGGISAADFTELMDLIQSTIQPDSWEDAEGLGTIRPYAAGVFVDPSGTLKKMKTSKTVDWNKVRNQLDTDGTTNQARLRKVSLTRLEKQMQLHAASGKSITDEMRFLGGIYEVRYLMFYPETNDIVIAGPAGPWQYDAEGRAVNTETGKPLLLLDDMVVCLRNAFEDDGRFGCSIDPTEKNLKATQQFLSTSKLQGEPWRREFRKAVGQQLITVHGIDRQSHAARVIVEADYRMKLVGMGLEPGIAEVPSYLDRVQLDEKGNPPPMDMARWWFTVNYDAVLTNEKRDIFMLKGNGVQLLSESELLNAKGERVHTGKSRTETKAFADDFTKHFEKMADKYPIYAEMKNVFDLALVSALIRHENLAGKLDWNLTYFGTPTSKTQLSYSILKDRLPKKVDSVMNFREINVRRGSKRLKHTIVGVSGGVEFASRLVVNKKKFQQQEELSQPSESSQPTESDSDKWFWD